MSFAPDTSVIIATLCAWHERHAWAHAAMTKRIESGEDLLLAAHCLVESYSVLTRLPPPHRIAPAVVADLLLRGFADAGRVVGIPPRSYWSLVRRARDLDIAGGRAYDALIARSIERGKAKELLTLHPTHFEGLAGESVRIVSP